MLGTVQKTELGLHHMAQVVIKIVRKSSKVSLVRVVSSHASK